MEDRHGYVIEMGRSLDDLTKKGHNVHVEIKKGDTVKKSEKYLSLGEQETGIMYSCLNRIHEQDSFYSYRFLCNLSHAFTVKIQESAHHSMFNL